MLGWENIDFRSLLSKALVHDLEECITGDIPRDFKHINLELNEHIDEMAEQSFQKIIHDLFPGDELIWTKIWRDAKDDTIEGRTICFADFLSVISYIYEETRIARSLVLREQLTSLHEYYQMFATEKFKMFKPLVEQVGEIMKEIFDGTD